MFDSMKTWIKDPRSHPVSVRGINRFRPWSIVVTGSFVRRLDKDRQTELVHTRKFTCLNATSLNTMLKIRILSNCWNLRVAILRTDLLSSLAKREHSRMRYLWNCTRESRDFSTALNNCDQEDITINSSLEQETFAAATLTPARSVAT
jgi:hypothetical protein